MRRKRYPWHALLAGAKARSKKDGITFDLTAAWAKSVWTGRCSLTGISFKTEYRSGPSMFSPSIDKIEPMLGYVQSNCRFVLWAVNAMKNTGTDDDMYLIASLLLKHRVISRHHKSSASTSEQAPSQLVVG
jgi:hypothetical protein